MRTTGTASVKGSGLDSDDGDGEGEVRVGAIPDEDDEAACKQYDATEGHDHGNE